MELCESVLLMCVQQLKRILLSYRRLLSPPKNAALSKLMLCFALACLQFSAIWLPFICHSLLCLNVYSFLLKFHLTFVI